MIRSMTGYGKGQYLDDKRSVTVELKSVNNRYLDTVVKIPRRFSFAEEVVKSAIKKQVVRGKLEASVQIENTVETETVVELSSSLAKEYINRLEELKVATGINQEISLEYIAGLPEVMTIVSAEADEEAIKIGVKKATEEALKNFIEMSNKEGEALAEDIKSRLELIRSYLDEIDKKAPNLIDIYKEKLVARIKILLENDIEVAEERISIEAAIIADKANVTEEIVRLKSHLAQVKNVLDNKDSSKGKKIDFLVQEMNRETNTIGSKANDLEITNIMIEMKSEVEKIREQIQNIQ